MARFYGTLRGSRGEATRCGTRTSGMTATAASWSGAVVAETYAPCIVPENRGSMQPGPDDFARVGLTAWHGNGRWIAMYDGPVNPTSEEFFAGLLPGAGAEWLRRAAEALLARAERREGGAS